MQKHQFFYLLFIQSCVYVTTLSESFNNCYANNNNKYLLFGTKTAYKVVFGQTPPPFIQEGCTPTLLWAVVRHGTRNPFFNELAALHQLKKLQTNILENEEYFKNVDLCAEDLANLKSWKFRVTHNESGLLTAQGEQEMYSLGQRVKQRFSNLFQDSNSSDKFVIQTTDSVRSKQSAEAFLKGLTSLQDINNLTSVNNSLLKGYKNCTMWKLEFGTNQEISRTITQFYGMKIMKELIQNVSSRLGFFFAMEQNEIFDMYEMCRYDRAFNQSSTYVSPWCAVFTEEQLKVLEFKDDLSNYYKHGYGIPLNLKVGCPLVQDMIVKFNNKINTPEEDTKNTVYFTSHGMFQRLLARLGVFNDSKPLTGKNVTSIKRQWRTSRIPFGANLVVVLYKCTENNKENHKVIFYLNEEILPVKGCDDGICSWDTIKDNFINITNSETCSLKDCFVTSRASVSIKAKICIYSVLLALVTAVFLSAT